MDRTAPGRQAQVSLDSGGGGGAAAARSALPSPLDVLLEEAPRTQQHLIEKGQLEGRLTEARASLRRVLARRQLTPSKDDDARIEACTDLATLERWLDRVVTAISVSDALE